MRSRHEYKCCYLSIWKAKKHWIGKITPLLWVLNYQTLIAACHSFHTHDGSSKETRALLWNSKYVSHHKRWHNLLERSCSWSLLKVSFGIKLSTPTYNYLLSIMHSLIKVLRATVRKYRPSSGKSWKIDFLNSLWKFFPPFFLFHNLFSCYSLKSFACQSRVLIENA